MPAASDPQRRPIPFAQPAPGSGSARPSAARLGLPSWPTPLIGRERELGAARRTILRPEVRLLTLLGPPGIGKTRLALALAEELIDRFEGGARFVDLAPLREHGLVMEAVVRALEVPEVGDRPHLARLRRAVADRKLLLLLDNFEQVLEAASEVAELLAGCPNLKIVVTSRTPLSLRWEHRFFVARLGLPDPGSRPDPVALMRSPAVALFLARARMIRPDLALTADNAASVAELCVRLDGLPLAIELAAAHADLLPPAQILAGLARRGLDWLASPGRDRSTRHETMRVAIDWSHDLLPARDRELFRRLSVFVGGLTGEGAQTIGGDGTGSPEAVQDALTGLARANLLVTETTPAGASRFSMLETIRAYAREKLEASGELAEVEERHARYYLDLAEQAEAGLAGPEQVAWLQRLVAEQDNLRAALGWSRQPSASVDLGWRLAAALRRFWEMRGHLLEGGRWLGVMVAESGQAPPRLRARLLEGAGTMAWRRGDLAWAAVCQEEGLHAYQVAGDAAGMALAINNLGILAREGGDYQRAISLGREGLALARKAGDRGVLVLLSSNLGLTLREVGDLEAARTALEEGLAEARLLGNPRLILAPLHNLGELAHLQGDHDRALDLLVESLSLWRAVGDRILLTYLLEGLGATWAAQGQFALAARLLATAEALRQALDSPAPPTQLAWLQQVRTLLRKRLGDRALARAWSQGWAMPVEEAVELALGPDASSAAAGPSGRPTALSRRELEVAGLIARGFTNRQIAQALSISEGTAIIHVRHIMDKLDFTSRAQIAAWAVEHAAAQPGPGTD